MKISKLIKDLEKHMAKHGDVECYIEDPEYVDHPGTKRVQHLYTEFYDLHSPHSNPVEIFQAVKGCRCGSCCEWEPVTESFLLFD